jgi:hypothetical protein
MSFKLLVPGEEHFEVTVISDAVNSLHKPSPLHKQAGSKISTIMLFGKREGICDINLLLRPLFAHNTVAI